MGLVALVTVVASVVAPATPPSIAELGPSARDRIEEARQNQGLGSGDVIGGECAAGEVNCVESDANDPTARAGSASAIPPPLEVAAGRRCFGNPPRQTEDPHSPPCVFEIFKGDNGGATAPGVTETEIRVAVPIVSEGSLAKEIVTALIAHFNLRYEFYGRRLSPVFVPEYPRDDPAANKALAENLLAEGPFGVISWYSWASSAIIYERLAKGGVVSAVSRIAHFDSDDVVDGFTWLVEPPLDVRLRAGAAFVCRAFNGRPARHAGQDIQATTSSRKFAIVVMKESGARPDPGPLKDGLRGCRADLEVFDAPAFGRASDFQSLMLRLKTDEYTTVSVVGSFNLNLFQAASTVNYFPEWMNLGMDGLHSESVWAGSAERGYTVGHGGHTFGFTSDARVRSDAEEPATWALREGGSNTKSYDTGLWYKSLLVLASGIQGAGPNLTPETFAEALRSTEFPNPNSGAPPYWQQAIGFGPADSVFHDDFAVWWWNENAPSQTSGSSSGRGSFCYLERGGRFTADTFPRDADSKIHNPSEPCR